MGKNDYRLCFNVKLVLKVSSKIFFLDFKYLNCSILC